MMEDRTASMHKSSIGLGDVLNDRYVIESVIDRGGMGIVLGGRHRRLDKRVAIKMLLPELSMDPGIVARFVREGQMIAQIKSDHVVRVYDVDVTPSGMPYLVMEWLDGQDLKSFCRSRKTDVVEIGFAVRCIIEACDALDAAHALGIVHRDLKPSNMFLSRGPRGTVRVKLIDFGISKQENTSLTERDERTKTGIVLGTTDYMPPEQIRASNRVDGRADIWSLGVTLYKLVTGRVPFRGGEAIATYALILGAAPKPPSALCPDLPAELEAIILKCLEKNPANRYGNAHDLARALAPFAEQDEKTILLELPQAPPSRPTTISTKHIQVKPRGHRTWGMLGTAVIIAMSITLVVKINRAEATVARAQRMAHLWQAPTLNVKPPVIAEIAAIATPPAEAPRPTSPVTTLRPTTTERAVPPRPTPPIQTDGVVTQVETPHVSTTPNVAEEKPLPTPELTNTTYGF